MKLKNCAKRFSPSSYFLPLPRDEHEQTLDKLFNLCLPHCSHEWRSTFANYRKCKSDLINVDYVFANGFDNLMVPDFMGTVVDRQLLALFQKDDSLCLNGVDKKKVAEKAYFEAEESCRLTNERLLSPDPSRFDALIVRATDEIKKILGALPSYDQLDCAFGPGINIGLKKEQTSVYHKLDTDWTVLTALAPDIREVMDAYPHLIKNQCLRYAYGKLVFVPKNAKTFRSICIAPKLNSFIQKGYGAYIRTRLKKYGVDLNDQSVNQNLAQLASLNDKLATIDLKSASDNISIMAVMRLLPEDWYQALATWRTRSVTYDGSVIDLEKFSGMGDGFTFELESLIFYGLARAVCSLNGESFLHLSVYGDDIVLPSSCTDDLTQLFTYMGFTINSAKSFSFGPFRESCGSDFLLGMNVRPFYIRDSISIHTLVSFYNFLIRNNDRDCEEFYGSLRSYLSGKIRSYGFNLFGPDNGSDGHMISDTFSYSRPRLGSTLASYVTFSSVIARNLRDPEKEASPSTHAVINTARYYAYRKVILRPNYSQQFLFCGEDELSNREIDMFMLRNTRKSIGRLAKVKYYFPAF